MDRSCGGQVLRCLTENQDKLSTNACKDEVFYFIKMEVNDYRNDAPLAEACRTDVEKHCKKVEPGELLRLFIAANHWPACTCAPVWSLGGGGGGGVEARGSCVEVDRLDPASLSLQHQYHVTLAV